MDTLFKSTSSWESYLPDSKQYLPKAFISAVLHPSLGSVDGGSKVRDPIFSIFSCPPTSSKLLARLSLYPYTTEPSIKAVAWFICSRGPGIKTISKVVPLSNRNVNAGQKLKILLKVNCIYLVVSKYVSIIKYKSPYTKVASVRRRGSHELHTGDVVVLVEGILHV